MNLAPAVPAPPFCPNPACRFHRGDNKLWRYIRAGFYSRTIPPYRVQRWRCVTCRRYFAAQTFRFTYWLHRPELVLPVYHRLVGCSGFRQIAREFKASPDTIRRLSGRLGRHSLLFHQRHRPKGALTEPLALDSFESFEYSQYYPTSYHVSAGQRTHFFYGFTDSECRRRGNMTPGQRRRRAALEQRLGKPDPRSIEKEVALLLGMLAGESERVELHTDSHKSYPRAVRRMQGVRIDHRTISSRAARTSRNPLFSINLLDLLIRHNGANHKRETIAFSKRRASGAYRLAHYLVYRNWVRPFSERRGGPTPAMSAGVATRRLEPEEILGWRLFPSKEGLPDRWNDYYRKSLPTRALARNTSHDLKYAI